MEMHAIEDWFIRCHVLFLFFSSSSSLGGQLMGNFQNFAKQQRKAGLAFWTVSCGCRQRFKPRGAPISFEPATITD